MRFRAVLRFLAAAVLLGATQVTPAHAANYGGPLQCWVTETGLGVCAPFPNDRVPLRYRRARGERRR